MVNCRGIYESETLKFVLFGYFWVFVLFFFYQKKNRQRKMKKKAEKAESLNNPHLIHLFLNIIALPKILRCSLLTVYTVFLRYAFEFKCQAL